MDLKSNGESNTNSSFRLQSPTNAQINGHKYEWKKQLVSVRENVRLEDELSKVTSTRKIEHVTKVCIVTVGEHPYY